MTNTTDISRRQFVAATASVAAAAPLAFAARQARPRGGGTMNVGLIGCGGRGTGAARNALEASEDVRIVALADVFADRLAACRTNLDSFGDRGRVAKNRCSVGFDAYQELIDGDVDIVILATPPHFRPVHFEAATAADKHVFMEKPVAVDPAGIRRVLAAAKESQRKGLSVVAGTQRRHEASYLAAMQKVREGALGEICAARCYWNMGGLWVKEQQPEWTDMEWQLRNWLYFTWLSGDHICEQHVHNLDVVNWAMGAHPIRALGLGGRQARTQPQYGHIFDHFAIEYEYPDGQFLLSMCRQQDGTASSVQEVIHGTKGKLFMRPGYAVIEGPREWGFEGANSNPYVVEHHDLHASIRSGAGLNEAQRVAESTLTAIMGRMSAYTGQVVTWDAALSSALDLTPPEYVMGPMPVPPVAIPGRTPLV